MTQRAFWRKLWAIYLGRVHMVSLNRRHLLTATGAAVLVGSGAFAARWFNITARDSGEMQLSPEVAHQAALDGRILLIDIRRPDEWALTGVGEGAHPLDMRRPDFIAALEQIAGGQVLDLPIALICARGVRSRMLGAHLEEAGFTQILDVPEGMLGSGAGPGWLGRGLPVTPWQA